MPADDEQEPTAAWRPEEEDVAMSPSAGPGIMGVSCMADFVTVTKDPAVAWEEIVPTIAAAIHRVVHQN
jgi:hypothetical protein